MALGTYIALGVMLITNFAIDAPWTKHLTNKFTAMINKHHENKKINANLNDKSKKEVNLNG